MVCPGNPRVRLCLAWPQRVGGALCSTQYTHPELLRFVSLSPASQPRLGRSGPNRKCMRKPTLNSSCGQACAVTRRGSGKGASIGHSSCRYIYPIALRDIWSAISRHGHGIDHVLGLFRSYCSGSQCLATTLPPSVLNEGVPCTLSTLMLPPCVYTALATPLAPPPQRIFTTMLPLQRHDAFLISHSSAMNVPHTATHTSRKRLACRGCDRRRELCGKA